jgi:energy-coupling factor transport system ATP-binding protein
LNVSYTYKSAAGSLAALNGLSFSLPRGRSLALMGHTGSGKSTALKLANALILPDSGAVHILGDDTQNPKVDLRALRFRAALAVQNPENALFETYVCDDVAFGPRNKGLRGEALVNAVRQAMEAAGLPFDEYAARPTYALSGGEKRLAALAGLLAMDADLYLLDEPAAGLDGANTRRVLALLDVLKARGKTIVAATHSVELAQKQDFLLTMNAGSCQLPVAGCQLSKGVRQAKRRTGVEFFNTDDAGGYLGIPSVLSRMGAAAKIVVFSLAAVAVFVGKTHFLAAGGIVFTLFCAVFAGRIRMGYMLRGLLPLLPFLLILTAVQFVFNFQADASPVIFRLGAAVLTTTELFTTVRTSLRFAAIISVLRLYSAVTSPKDSLAAIKKLLQPLAKIGLPLNDIVLAATVTTRFIPILRAEARAIVEAQAARGARFSGFGRLRCLFSLILPLFIRALERAQTLAAAITMRGYR